MPIRLTCLVDNTVKTSSAYWGEHGLAFLVQAGERSVLFDTGATGQVLFHNLRVAGVEIASISSLALSHGHADHTGGLPAFLEARGSLPVYYAHDDLLQERGSRKDDAVKSIGLPMDAQALRRRADLRLSPRPVEIAPGVWTTGQIEIRRAPEGRSVGHVLQEGNEWVLDPYRDDMALVLEGVEGLVLLCGCSHSGVGNILLQVQHSFGQAPVVVIGGMHLGGADEGHLRQVIELMRQMGQPRLYPNHCTGRKAIGALEAAFGDRVSPCPAGTVIEC